MANLLLASQYNGFYSTLNTIRARHGAGAIPVSSVGARTAALSSQMTTLQNSINTVKNTDSHLQAAAINTTVPNIGKGTKILWSTKTTIDSILNQMLAVCHHDSANYTNCNSDDTERETDDYFDTGDQSDLRTWHDCGGDHAGCDALTYSDT